jgi:HEPN domain-containing protein
MNDDRSHARAWLAKAESDRLAARRLLEAGGPFDAVCFHAQQACEKALKSELTPYAVETRYDAEFWPDHD